MYDFSRLALLLSCALVAAPAAAQLTEGEKATPEQVAAGEAQTAAPAPPMTPPEEQPVPIMVVPWSKADAEALLDYVQRVHEEGLDPADYNPQGLRDALAAGEGAGLNSAASSIFLRLSSDLSLGHARGEARVGWHIEDSDLSNGGQQYALMLKATQDHTVRDTLSSLLPTHPQYAELKSVLAETPRSDRARIDKIRANMDRWRWLPRDLGQKYVIVNVPAYSIALVENGQVVARHRAVVGTPKTATPQLSATMTGVIFNPWWELPNSIIKEVGPGAGGYITTKREDGSVRMRQKPGPGNALGRMKIVMPNDYAIYLHDTPSKALFKKDRRAFSHGCIRTQDALGFAQTLLAPTGSWDKAQIDETIASGKTVKVDMAAPVPVYITYFTAAAAKDKGGIIAYDDIYGRDDPVAVALNDRPDTALASTTSGGS